MKHETTTVIGFFVCISCLVFSADLDASCCSSAALGGVGRLLAHERALVELSESTRFVVGSFNSKGLFTKGATPHSPYVSFEPELQAMTRIFDYFEPFIKLPMRIQKSDRRVASNLADITSGARIPLFKENAIFGLPGLAMVAAVRMPTGASMERDIDITAEEITGSGKWQYSLSALLEKEWHSINFSLGYGFSFEPDYFRDVALKPGAVHSPLFAMGFLPHEGGILSLALAMAFHTQPKVNGRPLVDADRRKMTISVSYVVALHSHIKVNTQLGSDVPIDNVGKNFSNEAFFRIGMRFGVF